MTTALKSSARDRLLAAANELFYQEGVHTVGIDRIIERAGVAKASLYNTFGSKDELVRAYLELRHAARRESVRRAFEGIESPRERMLAMFDQLDVTCRQQDFRGCAFVNASGEAKPGGVVEQVTDEYRLWIRSVFEGLAIEAGSAKPAQLARHLQVLYDGALIASKMDRDPEAAMSARDAAAALIDAAVTRR